MPISPLIVAGAGAAISAAGAFFGSNTTTQSIDPAVMASIIAAIKRSRQTQFVPNEAAFNEGIQLDIDEIMFQAGISEEMLEADFSSRGVNRSPQAIQEIIRLVRAPAVRAAGSAVVQGKLGFEQLKLQGIQGQQSFEAQLLAILGGGNKTITGPNQLGQTAGEFGDFLFEFGLFDQFGLFGEDPVAAAPVTV